MSERNVRGTRRARFASTVAGTLLALTVTALAPGASWSAVFDLRPGAEGRDTSPYAFIPSLVRGNYETMYAQTAVDENMLPHDQIAYLAYDLPPGLLQPGETVLSATLFMVFSFTFSHDGSPPPPGGELYVHEVTAGWDEQTLNWNNRPAFGPTIASRTDIDAFASYSFDVTDTVRFWAHGTTPNEGFAVTNPTDVPIGFHSWESNADPLLKNHLVIVTGPGSPPPTVPGLGPIAAVGLSAAIGALGGRRARAQLSSR